MDNRKRIKQAINRELREHKSSFYVYMVLRILTIITLVFQILSGNWESAFLAAAVGFSLVDVLNKSEKLTFNLSPLFTVMVAFCFSMKIGAVWEIFEFSMDMLAGFDMQKDTVVTGISSVLLDPTGGNTPTAIPNIEEVYVNGAALGVGGYIDIGIIDTMYDLIVNFVGAVVFSVIAYVHIKTEGMSRIVSKLVLRRKKHEEDYLENEIVYELF